MRRFVRLLLLMCGTALICLRLYPFREEEWGPRLFQDETVYSHANDFAVWLIVNSGLSFDRYEDYAANLATLTHTAVIIIEVVVIGLLFFIAARKIQ